MQTKNLQHMRKQFTTLGLLILCLTIPSNYAYAQQNTASNAEIRKLQTALSQALDKIETLDNRLKAASEAIDALKQERDAAQTTIAAAKAERESLERSVAIAERAIAAQKEALAIYEKALAVQDKLIERQGNRIDNLEVKLDKANSRVVKSGLIGFAVGVATALIKIF